MDVSELVARDGALVPVRRVPFSKPQLDRIAAVLRDREVPGWSAVQHQAIDVAFKFGLSLDRCTR